MRQTTSSASRPRRAGLIAASSLIVAGGLTAGSALGQTVDSPGRPQPTTPIVFATDEPAPFIDAAWSVTSGDDSLRPLVQPVSCEEPCDGYASGGGCGSGAGGPWANPCGPPTWVSVTPYVWAPAMKGDIGGRGVVRQIDLSLSDLVDLIPDLNGAAMGHVEVGKGRRGLIFDALALRVSPSQPGPAGGTLNFNTDLAIFEALGTYRVAGTPNGTPHASPVRFDLLGGARYYQINGGLTIDTIRGRTISAAQSETWVDLVVGGRGTATITPGLDAFLRADVGGFGIGTSSSLSWNVVTGVDYDLDCCPGSSLIVGYKALDVDQSKNGGQFVYDVRSQGPLLALSFSF